MLEIHRILGRDGYKIEDTYIIDKKNNKTILDVIEDHLSKDFNIYATRSAQFSDFHKLVYCFGMLDIGSPTFWKQNFEENALQHVPGFNKVDFLLYVRGIYNSTQIHEDSLLYKMAEITFI